MVEARENRAMLRGRVRGIGPPDVAAPSGWSALDVEVVATEDVPDFPNMLDQLAGSSTVLLVPDEDLASLDLQVGQELEVRARRTGPREVLADRRTVRRVGPVPSPGDQPAGPDDAGPGATGTLGVPAAANPPDEPSPVTPSAPPATSPGEPGRPSDEGGPGPRTRDH